MKEKIKFVYIALTLVALLFQGCFYCGDHVDEEKLHAFTLPITSIAYMDSLREQYAKQKKWSSYDITDESSLKANYDKNKFVYNLSWDNTKHKGVDGIVLNVKLYACTPDDNCDYNFVDAEKVSSLTLELYGCDNFTCKNTSRIVVHDDQYRYVRSFDRKQFSITDGGDFSYSTDGDCTIYKKLSFNLVIDAENFKINWNLKDGRIYCNSTKCDVVTDYSVWG